VDTPSEFVVLGRDVEHVVVVESLMVADPVRILQRRQALLMDFYRAAILIKSDVIVNRWSEVLLAFFGFFLLALDTFSDRFLIRQKLLCHVSLLKMSRDKCEVPIDVVRYLMALI